MLRARFIPLAIGLAMAAIVASSGCGSSSSAEPSPASAAEFNMPGTKENKFTGFGQEANAEEREAASEVLEQNMQARAEGEWESQCSTLNAFVLGQLEKSSARFSPGVKKDCPDELKAQAEPLAQSKAIRANTMTGPIDVLVVRGRRGYALYHGTGGKDYAMQMEKGTNGEWKVGSLVTTELP